MLRPPYLLLVTLLGAGSVQRLRAQAVTPLPADSAATFASPTEPLRFNLLGSVVDELNNPLAGVSVKLAGGTITDVCISNSSGHFLLDVPTAGGTVLLTFQGYHPQEFNFAKVKEVHIVMQPLPGFKRERKARVIYRRHNKSLNDYPDL